MIFDITYINDGGLSSVQYRPRNKAFCNGVLQYKGITIASLKTLAICYNSKESLVGGRFELEWFRHTPDINILEDCLCISIEYGVGRPPEIQKRWSINSIAIVDHGVPHGISNIEDLMSGEHPFFSINLKEEILAI